MRIPANVTFSGRFRRSQLGCGVGGWKEPKKNMRKQNLAPWSV